MYLRGIVSTYPCKFVSKHRTIGSDVGWSLRKINSVLANDRESRSIRHVEACCADNGIDLPLQTISTDDTFLGNLLDWSKVHINILLLDSLHIRIALRKLLVMGPRHCERTIQV